MRKRKYIKQNYKRGYLKYVQAGLGLKTHVAAFNRVKSNDPEALKLVAEFEMKQKESLRKSLQLIAKARAFNPVPEGMEED